MNLIGKLPRPLQITSFEMLPAGAYAPFPTVVDHVGGGAPRGLFLELRGDLGRAAAVRVFRCLLENGGDGPVRALSGKC
jgi:hypothetical protein